MNSFGLTDVGRRRTTNQDFVYISETPVGNLPNLFVVADGMGGHNAGDLASRYAVEQFLKSVKENPEENPVSIMEEAAEAANWETYQKAGTDPALFVPYPAGNEYPLSPQYNDGEAGRRRRLHPCPFPFL